MKHLKTIFHLIALLSVLGVIGCAHTPNELKELGALKEVPMNKPYKIIAECVVEHLDNDMCFSFLFQKACPSNVLRYKDATKEAEIIGTYPSSSRYLVSIISTGDNSSIAKIFVTNQTSRPGAVSELASDALAKCN